MTIEERARNYAPLEENDLEGFSNEQIYKITEWIDKAYVSGATEQRKIDETLILQAMEDGELLAYNCEKRCRKEMTDKACEWLGKRLPITGFEIIKHEFRKAMEE